jgi:hypothetical protein
MIAWLGEIEAGSGSRRGTKCQGVRNGTAQRGREWKDGRRKQGKEIGKSRDCERKGRASRRTKEGVKEHSKLDTRREREVKQPVTSAFSRRWLCLFRASGLCKADFK